MPIRIFFILIICIISQEVRASDFAAINRLRKVFDRRALPIEINRQMLGFHGTSVDRINRLIKFGALEGNGQGVVFFPGTFSRSAPRPGPTLLTMRGAFSRAQAYAKRIARRESLMVELSRDLDEAHRYQREIDDIMHGYFETGRMDPLAVDVMHDRADRAVDILALEFGQSPRRIKEAAGWAADSQGVVVGLNTNINNYRGMIEEMPRTFLGFSSSGPLGLEIALANTPNGIGVPFTAIESIHAQSMQERYALERLLGLSQP